MTPLELASKIAKGLGLQHLPGIVTVTVDGTDDDCDIVVTFTDGSESYITAQMLDKHVWNEQANNGGLYSQIDYLMLGYQDCRIAFENVKAIFENIALENKINARREN